jgi:hypothetical protein
MPIALLTGKAVGTMLASLSSCKDERIGLAGSVEPGGGAEREVEQAKGRT